MKKAIAILIVALMTIMSSALLVTASEPIVLTGGQRIALGEEIEIPGVCVFNVVSVNVEPADAGWQQLEFTLHFLNMSRYIVDLAEFMRWELSYWERFTFELVNTEDFEDIFFRQLVVRNVSLIFLLPDAALVGDYDALVLSLSFDGSPAFHLDVLGALGLAEEGTGRMDAATIVILRNMPVLRQGAWMDLGDFAVMLDTVREYADVEGLDVNIDGSERIMHVTLAVRNLMLTEFSLEDLFASEQTLTFRESFDYEHIDVSVENVALAPLEETRVHVTFLAPNLVFDSEDEELWVTFDIGGMELTSEVRDVMVDGGEMLKIDGTSTRDNLPTGRITVSVGFPIPLIEIEFFTMHPNAAHNSWTRRDGDIIRVLSNPWTDNTGTGHTNGGIIAGASSWNELEDRQGLSNWGRARGNGHSITYLLDSNFSRFTGTIALDWDNRDAQRSYQIRILGDNRVLFLSPEISGGSLPLDFDVDVTGVTLLRIERVAEGNAAVAIINPILYAVTELSERLPVPGLEGVTTHLAQLDFFTLSPSAASNSWTWRDDNSIRTIGTAGRDNTGNTYAHSGIVAGASNWNELEDRQGLSNWGRARGNEHSITYLINSNYSRFTGTIAFGWESRDAQRIYQIRVWGDGTLLYTSPEITGGTLPVDFDIDVSGITQLRIERIAGGNAAILIANPGLHR